VASGAASSASTSASTATTQATAAASSATSAANSAAVATGFTASLAGRNKIINGSFIINQRAYVSGTATTAANQYTLDRWRVVVSGQTLPFAASGNGRLVTAPAGGLEQVIESGHIEGGPFTLSWTGTAVATLNGTSITKGGTVTLPANTNATVRFSSGTVGFVQLEAGSVATPFEHRMLPVETFLCQRYALSLVGWWPAQCTSTTTATVMLPVSTPLRGLPTYIPNGTANVSGATSLFLPVTGTTVSLSGSGAPTLLVTVASGLVAGNATALIAPNAILSAEL
jgi:hypothetical protein